MISTAVIDVWFKRAVASFLPWDTDHFRRWSPRWPMPLLIPDGLLAALCLAALLTADSKKAHRVTCGVSERQWWADAPVDDDLFVRRGVSLRVGRHHSGSLTPAAQPTNKGR